MAGPPLGAALCDWLLFGSSLPHHGGERSRMICKMRSPTDPNSEFAIDGAAGDGATCPETVLILYPRRWLMLMLFCLLSCVNGAMWIQFASVANICQSYFSTSALAVDWLSMIYMALYIPGAVEAPRSICRRPHGG